MNRTRAFLAVGAIIFALASAVHGGWLIDGYQHLEARIAEGVIAIVLMAGLVVSLINPPWTRRAGLLAQGFALLGTLVGVFTIIVGVGPRTTPDVILHIGLIVLLVWGLASTRSSVAETMS
jgi:hypothetical protein